MWERREAAIMLPYGAERTANVLGFFCLYFPLLFQEACLGLEHPMTLSQSAKVCSSWNWSWILLVFSTGREKWEIKRPSQSLLSTLALS